MKGQKIMLDQEKVKRLIKYKYGTIEKYCQNNNISRMRLWKILNNPHFSPDVKCLQDLSNNLGVSIQDILM